MQTPIEKQQSATGTTLLQPKTRVSSTEKRMIKTLEAALSELRGQPVRIQRIERETCVHSSSFHAEHLRVMFKGGECVPVFFKDLNPRHQIEPARKVRKNNLGPSYHELRVYRKILSRVNLGTPQLYSVRWEPGRGIYWLFLEDIGTSRLRDSRNYARWVPAARWAARFHAATRNLPPYVTRFLPAYDYEHYRRCAERVRGILPGLEPRDRKLAEPALEHYVNRLEWFAGLPRNVIHGQYFGKNIMLRSRNHDQALAVIDWETAALGPGTYDLVSVSSGRWTDQQRRAMWRAYFDQYCAETGLPRDWKDFCEELREMELYQALEWLGWWRNRRVSHNFGKWIKELARIMRDKTRENFGTIGENNHRKPASQDLTPQIRSETASRILTSSDPRPPKVQIEGGLDPG
jgi:hypothetical protein